MLLLSVQGQGALFSVCILFFCVIIIHIIKLALLGWNAYKNRNVKKEKAPPPPEPVYYIVEKKKKSAPEYKKPKKIKFQK